MSIRNQEITTNGEEETRHFAAQFAMTLSSGDIVCLSGDLGAGKSVFCRAAIRALCAEPALEVPSPTFTLVQNYEAGGRNIWHFDLYRLAAPDEVYEIGWEEAMAGGIAMVEWPERLGGLLPARRIDVKLDAVSSHPNQRKISIIHYG